MKSSDDRERERREHHTEEWLSLSLGRDPPLAFRDAVSQSRQAPAKIFSCNYCMRKFYSSQALGGHQNAHKRERGAIRRYQSQGVMTMMTVPINTTIIRSLGVQAHSLVHKSDREKGSVVAKFNQASTGWSQMEWHHLTEETRNLMWPGSFRLEQQPPHQYQSSPAKIDLNLKL